LKKKTILEKKNWNVVFVSGGRRPPFNTTCSFWIPKWFLFFECWEVVSFLNLPLNHWKLKPFWKRKLKCCFVSGGRRPPFSTTCLFWIPKWFYFFGCWEVHLGKMKGYIFPKFQKRSK
jgi:hypothetical protein